MASSFPYQEAFRLGDKLQGLSPEEFAALIQGLCRGVQAQESGFHGGVNAGNISFDLDKAVGLGAPLGDNVQYTADQIEYLAPEVFWKNERGPQADVYSIGLIMYTWANGGCLPFLYPDAPATDRAEALRRRMSGEAFDIPQVAHSLGSIIEKATEFSPDDRYADCEALLDAFHAFVSEVEVDSALIAGHVETQRRKRAEEEQMMAGILAAAEAATAPQQRAQPTQQYRVDTTIPDREPERHRHGGRPFVVVLVLAAILMVAAVAMQFTQRREHNEMLENTSPTPGSVMTSPTPGQADTSPTLSPDGNDPDPTPSPSATPEPTATPSPSPTPTPTPPPAGEHTYTLYWEDVSWNQAADKCIELGGDLVVINDEAEFKKVTDLADTYGVELVWVGGFRKDGQICWVNGETSDYYPWAAGEPSYRDTDGTAESFLLLWKLNGEWVYNDSRDNPIAAYPAAYRGKIAYICETK